VKEIAEAYFERSEDRCEYLDGDSALAALEASYRRAMEAGAVREFLLRRDSRAHAEIPQAIPDLSSEGYVVMLCHEQPILHKSFLAVQQHRSSTE
jgi:hypothetical protein